MSKIANYNSKVSVALNNFFKNARFRQETVEGQNVKTKSNNNNRKNLIEL